MEQTSEEFRQLRSDLASLRARVVVLESALRASSASTPPSQVPDTIGTLRCRRLELVDEGGRLRAAVTTTPEGDSGLWFYDTTGERRIAVSTQRGGDARIEMHGTDGGRRVLLATSASGSTLLRASDSDAKERVSISVYPNKKTSFVIRDPQEVDRLSLGVTDAGDSYALNFDAAGACRQLLLVSADGKTVKAAMRHKSGKDACWVECLPPTSSDPDGRVRRSMSLGGAMEF